MSRRSRPTSVCANQSDAAAVDELACDGVDHPALDEVGDLRVEVRVVAAGGRSRGAAARGASPCRRRPRRAAQLSRMNRGGASWVTGFPAVPVEDTGSERLHHNRSHRRRAAGERLVRVRERQPADHLLRDRIARRRRVERLQCRELLPAGGSPSPARLAGARHAATSAEPWQRDADDLPAVPV